MKNILLAMILSLAFVATAGGETKPASPQTDFQVVGDDEIDAKNIKIPAKLPNEVIQILRLDERNQGCLGGGSDGEIPAAWFKAFKASEIDLNADRLQDLIVMPADACLYGANIVPFWVFLQTPKGYRLVLNVSSHGLEVLKTKTNGYSDISATRATAIQVFSSVFRFNGKQYEIKKTSRKR